LNHEYFCQSNEEDRVAVKIRMKMMGRKHRPYFRICAMDVRRPRDGRVLEELGTYDPLVSDTDARVKLNGERVNYWLGVGAQPTEKVRTFIKKYGASGTHLAQQAAAREKLALPKVVPPPGEPAFVPKPAGEAQAEAQSDAGSAGEAPQSQPSGEETSET
jgi:small subunit ribosomal protein S16